MNDSIIKFIYELSLSLYLSHLYSQLLLQIFNLNLYRIERHEQITRVYLGLGERRDIMW